MHSIRIESPLIEIGKPDGMNGYPKPYPKRKINHIK